MAIQRLGLRNPLNLHDDADQYDGMGDLQRHQTLVQRANAGVPADMQPPKKFVNGHAPATSKPNGERQDDGFNKPNPPKVLAGSGPKGGTGGGNKQDDDFNSPTGDKKQAKPPPPNGRPKPPPIKQPKSSNWNDIVSAYFPKPGADYYAEGGLVRGCGKAERGGGRGKFIK